MLRCRHNTPDGRRGRNVDWENKMARKIRLGFIGPGGIVRSDLEQGLIDGERQDNRTEGIDGAKPRRYICQ